MKLQSDKLEKITPALIGARKEIFGAVKNGRGNWGKYASLEDIIEAINEPLLNHDIFVSQASSPIEGDQYIVTQATHVSGQWMRSYTKVELQQAGNPQKALASQTYTRRAGMEALFNIPRVDDDGEHGNKQPEAKAEEYVALVSTEERDDFIKHVIDSGVPNSSAKEVLAKKGINNSNEIPKDKLTDLKKAITAIANDMKDEVTYV